MSISLFQILMTFDLSQTGRKRSQSHGNPVAVSWRGKDLGLDVVNISWALKAEEEMLFCCLFGPNLSQRKRQRLHCSSHAALPSYSQQEDKNGVRNDAVTPENLCFNCVNIV
jgi:hypothetical protein